MVDATDRLPADVVAEARAIADEAARLTRWVLACRGDDDDAVKSLRFFDQTEAAVAALAVRAEAVARRLAAWPAAAAVVNGRLASLRSVATMVRGGASALAESLAAARGGRDGDNPFGDDDG